jgi:RsiW-degrading membrane proteinase PrsW (M82 family)
LGVSFRCACGLPLGGLACACGAAYEARPGWRAVRCECGSVTLAAPAQVGTSIPCAGCFLRVAVTPDAPEAGPALKTPPRRVSKPPRDARDILRYFFALTLAPLLLYSATEHEDPPLRQEVERALKENPALRSRRESIKTLDDLFSQLEIEKVAGALHPRFTSAQWIYAGVSALGFWGLILALFPLGRANSTHLWTVGILIGTAGIVLLLLIHRLPFVRAFYDAASGRSGFLNSLSGFLLGVGACEELVKLLPLAVVVRRGGNLDVRGATAWGLAMGAGFGVSEGIWYSAEFYNGLLPGDVYLVRFVSCVALHMVWSAAAAARLWDTRREVEAADNPVGIVLPMVLAAAGSIGLHGLYDVLLKFGANVGAVSAAGLSFLYFYWSVDRQRASEATS